MAMDISNILSVYGSSLLNKTSSTQSSLAGNTNFSNYLLNALSGTEMSTRSNESTLLSALSSSSNTSLVQALLSDDSYMNLLADSLPATAGKTGSAFSSLDGNPTGMDHQIPGSDYFSNMLTSSLQSQVMSMMANTKMKLEDDLDTDIEKTGDSPSLGVQQTITRMQNNISNLDHFISERKTENSLLDALNANSSFTQYLVNKNRSSAL